MLRWLCGWQRGRETPYQEMYQVPPDDTINIKKLDPSSLENKLASARNLGDEFEALEELGVWYQNDSKYEEAKDCHRKSSRIAIKLKDRAKEGKAYGNLGNVYYNQCDFRLTIYYQEKCLEIAQQENDEGGIGRAHCNLGNAYYRIGELEEAASHYKDSLEILKSLDKKRRKKKKKKKPLPLLGEVHGNLGNVLLAQGKTKEAKKEHKEARKIAGKDSEAAARSYINSGNLYLKEKKYDEAERKYKKALALAKTNKYWRGIGCARGNLSWVYINEEKMKLAKKNIKKCLEIAEEHKLPELEASAKYHKGYIAERNNKLEEALDHYESSLNLFNDIRIKLQSNYEWKITLREKYQGVYQAHWNVLLKLEKKDEALLAVDRGRAQTLDDHLISSHAQGPSRREFSKPADLLKLAEPPVLYCAVVEDDVHIWIIQESAVDHFKKSASPENDLESDIKELIESMNSGYKKVGADSAGGTSYDVLERLYDITVGQVDHITQLEELTIVPDGPLNLAPFSAFRKSKSSELPYLSDIITIRVVPSLFTLKLIQDNTTGNDWKGALIVGDPCMKRTLLTKNGERLKQIENAKKEAEMVAKLLNEEPLIGEKATKGEVLRRLGTVSLVHIAAHGSPETGEIALTPDLRPDDTSLTYEDCLLTMKDVSGTPSKARLVVLSCCDSGHGNVRAEGVIGIARAFLEAGARSVLATLWDIDDEATMMFMKFFYEKLVDGERASVALHYASNSLKRTKEYSTVNYWAPFVLNGDDVTIHVK